MRWIILSHFTCLLTASLEWSRQESIQFGLSPFWEIRQSSDPHRTGDAPTAHRSDAENEAAPTDLILYKAVCSIQKEHWTPEVTQWAIKETPHWLWQLNLFILFYFFLAACKWCIVQLQHALWVLQDRLQPLSQTVILKSMQPYVWARYGLNRYGWMHLRLNDKPK